MIIIKSSGIFSLQELSTSLIAIVHREWAKIMKKWKKIEFNIELRQRNETLRITNIVKRRIFINNGSTNTSFFMNILEIIPLLHVITRYWDYFENGLKQGNAFRETPFLIYSGDYNNVTNFRKENKIKTVCISVYVRKLLSFCRQFWKRSGNMLECSSFLSTRFSPRINL